MRAIRLPLRPIRADPLIVRISRVKQGQPTVDGWRTEAAVPLRMCGNSRRRYRSLAAWLGVFALLVQGLMPMGQAVPLAAVGDPAFLILCTGYGTRALPSEPGQSAPESRPWSCAVCQASAIGDSLVAPATVPVRQSRAVDAFIVPGTVQRRLGSSLSAPWQARAPPLA